MCEDAFDEAVAVHGCKSIPGCDHTTLMLPDFWSTYAAFLVAVCVGTDMGAVCCLTTDTDVHA